MRTKARTDANHSDITAELRAIGVSVLSIHMIGDGVPDIIVGFMGYNFLFEIKTTEQGKLSKSEEEWHSKWNGHKAVCHSVMSVLWEIFLFFNNRNLSYEVREINATIEMYVAKRGKR